MCRVCVLYKICSRNGVCKFVNDTVQSYRIQFKDSYTIYVVLAYLKDMFDIRLSYMHTEHICVHTESDLVAAVLFLVSSALVQSAARPKSAGYTQNETHRPIEQDTSMLHMKGMILCVWHTKIMHCK